MLFLPVIRMVAAVVKPLLAVGLVVVVMQLAGVDVVGMVFGAVRGAVIDSISPF